ncbi:uncharacterized protein LOC113558364 [Rhopalosiphum maidis]|uniref:uncharacterized protein LOC113558364 n=1 Tax=Rhopalosiphum maidis TaxID=43146 RepID=UPI000F00B259|nr:uncharacterized protein LOC113558364 [Rhopalosiphum maidis]
MSELNYAISSRKSTASGLDNISPVMLKHLPTIALESLLALMNNILSTQQIPPSWCSYKVIPIAKQNSNTSFRPIALSSALCKIFEHMLKSRLDWWLENNSILPDNLFSFRKGRGTTECLSSFTGNIYHSLNNKEFFVATSIDIRGAFDSVNIGTLISYLKSLNVPQQFNNILIALFNKRNLIFSSPFGSYNSRSTFTGLPQGWVISVLYTPTIWSFLPPISLLDLAITLQNQILNDLKVILDKISFVVAPEKCKSIIFTRRRYLDAQNIYFDNNIIPYVPNITYLGIILDAKLRWKPQITSLSATVSRWSNFLRSVTNTWWGSHPSSLLMIYRTLIRSKLDYGCFLYVSASCSNLNKINKLQISCHRNIMGYLRSTPCSVIEVESDSAPFNIRCRWLASKFLLKQLAHSNNHIFDMYYSLFLTWRYVPKSLPILSLTANSLSNFHQYILNSTKLPLYEQSYESLLFSPLVQTENNFSSLSSNDLQAMPVPMINKIFTDFLNTNFSNHIIVYTDGSVSPLSASFSFYIPELHISFTNNLPPSSSSFTAECYAIIEALILISKLAPNNYLIASDSLSCLLALKSNPFNSLPSPLALRIKHVTLTLHQSNYSIQFLWIPSHIGIYGNEVADNLAKSTSSLICPSLTQLPHTDFTPTIRHHIKHLWSSQWSNFPEKFAARYKHIVPIIPQKIWFNNLHLSRATIVQFNRQRSGHTTLPAHAYKLDLNDSPFCTLHITEMPCDLSHILFECPSLYPKRTTLFNSLKPLNISPNLYSILNSNSETVINLIITFILEAGFRI